MSILLFGVFFLFLFWAVYCTEMSYLGSFCTKFLYNFFSPVYELKWRTKNYTKPEILEKLFLQPTRKIIEKQAQKEKSTEILDLACGTGRFSQMILKESWLRKQKNSSKELNKIKIRAFDFSTGMLHRFEKKLQELKRRNLIEPEYKETVSLGKVDLNLWRANKEDYQKYQVVSLLEAGEFIPNFVKLVEQVSHLLEPGGIFILTKPPDSLAWTYFFRRQMSQSLRSLLVSNGFTKVSFHSWTSRYELVLATKAS